MCTVFYGAGDGNSPNDDDRQKALFTWDCQCDCVCGSMKAGFRYAVGVVIAVLVMVILFQLRNMSRLRNHMSRQEGDTRALHRILNSNDASSTVSQEQMRRLQRENEQLRDEVQRGRTNRANPAPGEGISRQ